MDYLKLYMPLNIFYMFVNVSKQPLFIKLYDIVTRIKSINLERDVEKT